MVVKQIFIVQSIDGSGNIVDSISSANCSGVVVIEIDQMNQCPVAAIQLSLDEAKCFHQHLGRVIELAEEESEEGE